MLSDLMESVKIAVEAGVDEKNIILDPGIGFAKTYHDNLARLCPQPAPQAEDPEHVR